MSTPAQISANQKNAQRSTGPKTEAGKANSCQNNLRHGFTGSFTLLPWEEKDAYHALRLGLQAEHRPQTLSETLLVDKMAQHHWLSMRALLLQDMTFHTELPFCEQEKQLALYIRYQTTHDRAFHKCLDQLIKVRAEKRKTEIGFESQERKRNEEERKRNEESRKQAEQARRDSVEKRKQDLHRFDVLQAEAKLDRESTQNRNLKSSANLDLAPETESSQAQKAA